MQLIASTRAAVATTAEKSPTESLEPRTPLSTIRSITALADGVREGVAVADEVAEVLEEILGEIVFETLRVWALLRLAERLRLLVAVLVCDECGL